MEDLTEIEKKKVTANSHTWNMDLNVENTSVHFVAAF